MGRRLQPDRRLHELESIYREHHRRVRWVLRSRGVADDALDDLAQEAFLAIFRRLPERDPTLPMGTWIAGVTRNIAFSHRRSAARRLAASRELPEPTTPVELDEVVARRRAWEQLQGFLDGLDADQREVFVLSDLLGMRVPEVAHVVDAPLNTLYSRLRLARRRFTDRFGTDPAQLQRAGKGECPSASQRRHAWLAIAAKLPLAAAPVAAAATGSLGLAWLLAGGITIAAAAVVFTAGPAPRGDEPSPTTPAASPTPPARAGLQPPPPAPAPSRSPPASPSSSPTEPAARALLPQEPTRAVQAGPAANSRASAPPEPETLPAAAALDATVEALRTAQRQLRDGRPADALATLDALVRDHADGPMPRERLRIERDAACAARLLVRAAAARDRLVRLGAIDASEPPCEKETSSP